MTIVVSDSLVKVMVRTASVAVAAGARRGQVQLGQRRHLGVQRIQGDLELDPFDQTVGHRIGLVVEARAAS